MYSTNGPSHGLLLSMRMAIYLFLVLSVSAPSSGQAGTAERLNNRGLITFETGAGEQLTIRLAGLELPRPGSPGHELAMRFIDGWLAAGVSELRLPADERLDRYGHHIADLHREDALLSEALVSAGYAIAYSWPDTRHEGAHLLVLEAEARSGNRGLWETDIFAIRSPDPNTLALYLETVQIVEGRVISAAETRERTYLNFGFDYRTDFTVSIAARDVRTFTDAGIDMDALEGRIIRVRGWLQAINGPSITIDHPERLEVLTP